jgi:hypothetical protein
VTPRLIKLKSKKRPTHTRRILTSVVQQDLSGSLGNTSGGHCRACLLEVEFLDVTAVDVLLNTGPNATAVRSDIAKAVAGAIINDLEHP